MLTLDEAIRHAQAIADNEAVCSSCRAEHRQLAEWLRELRAIKELTAYHPDYSVGIGSPLGIDLNKVPESCRGCPQHPSNGGSGICFCILGQPIIT